MRGDHPSGYRSTLLLPTWVRLAMSAIQTLDPAPTHTKEVLREAGMSEAAIGELFKSGVARAAWPGLSRYLPD